ncbi:hypothetical protein VTO42DRAFT_5543 [Malbranchea cinnamomea]
MSETAPAPSLVPTNSTPTVTEAAQPSTAEPTSQNGTIPTTSAPQSQQPVATSTGPPPPPHPSSQSHHLPPQPTAQPPPVSQPSQQPPQQQPPPPPPPPTTPAPAPAPAPPPPQQQHPLPPQPPVSTSVTIQYTQPHPPATTQPPPADASSLPPVHQNHAFTQPPPQQPQMAMGFGTIPMTMPGPTIAQYYPDMSGRVSSPDGYDVMDSSRLGRTKKDVKRRTKTGCLTCRKRRIKCDERHPICRNCEKSKRECLGYDPIFKSQAGPSAIQPAPSQPSLLVAPQTPSIGAQQPSTANQNNHAVPSAPTHPTPVPSATPSSVPPSADQQTAAGAPGPEGVNTTVPTAVPAQGTTEPQISTAPMANALEGAEKLQLRQASIEELLAVRGQICQPLDPVTGTPARIEDIKLLFMSYAVGIDQFLECRWFESKAMPHLLANGHLLAQYAALLDGFNDPQISEPTFLALLESRETRIIWDTMALCRQVQAQNPPSDSDPATTRDPELLSAVKRLSILEALMTGTTLEHNPVGVDVYPEADPTFRRQGLSGQIKGRELQFWDAIGRYLTISDDQPDCDKKRDHALMWTRTLLDSFENRDIIYSIAVVRHIAKFQPRKLKPLVGSSDEKDTAAKLYVACKFLEDETLGKGTNQVVKRISGMIIAYWDQPPYLTC